MGNSDFRSDHVKKEGFGRSKGGEKKGREEIVCSDYLASQKAEYSKMAGIQDSMDGFFIISSFYDCLIINK